MLHYLNTSICAKFSVVVKLIENELNFQQQLRRMFSSFCKIFYSYWIQGFLRLFRYFRNLKKNKIQSL